MKQSGNTIQNANLQEFLDSAANAVEQGQRQFYTPPTVAEALFRPLPAVRRHLIADLHFGNGSLAAASGAVTAIGLDIDARVRKDLKPPKDTAWHVEQADLTRWYGLAAEADLTLPFITINPPFSLKWYASRLSALAESDIDEVAACYRSHGEHIDSTLASYLIALDRLGRHGEGFMICNANTARRLIGDPQAATASPLLTYVWLWLEIPAMIFDNQMTDFPTAVLYFSRSHGNYNRGNNPPLYLAATSGDPRAIDSALMVPEVFSAHRGSRYTYEHEFGPARTLEKFRAVNAEYAVQFKGHKPDWNIAIDDKGRLRTHLTPFQEVSKRIPPQLVGRLHALNLKTPVSLCVTATSRTALREAAESGIWRIQPAVHDAIAAAMRDFEAAGAPFYLPNAVQALGWVDEYSALTCIKPGIGTAKPGDACTIKCSVEPTVWKGTKINLAGNPEDVEYTGRELLVKLTDSSDCEHHFHVRRDDAMEPPSTRHDGSIHIMHWHIADLIEHFQIPIPKDIVSLHPEKYRAHLQTLAALEARVNANLAKAS